MVETFCLILSNDSSTQVGNMRTALSQVYQYYASLCLPKTHTHACNTLQQPQAMQSNTSINRCSTTYTSLIYLHATCFSAIPAPPNDPQHTPVKGGPFASSLVVSFSKLILGAAEFIILFGLIVFLRFDFFVIGSVRVRVRIRSNAVMSLSLWLDGDETNGKQGKQRVGETVQAERMNRSKKVVDGQGRPEDRLFKQKQVVAI